MIVFSIINGAIDLAEEIIRSEKIGFPKTYSEMFELLKKKQVVTAHDLKKFKKLILLRNNIAHNYTKIEEKNLKSALVEVKVVKEFIKQVKLRVRKKII